MRRKPFRRGPPALLPGLACLLSLLVSCTSGPPEILGLEWTVEERPPSSAAGAPGGSLAVFARVRDPDGIEDLDSLWVINDEAELDWRLGPSTWTRRELGEDEWIGAADLRMPDGSAPPPGRYRLLLADLAGNRAGYDFKIEVPAKVLPPPEPSWNGSRVGLSRPWPENYLLAYDGSGALIRGSSLPPGGADLEALVGSADAARTQAFAVYGYDQAARRGAYSPRIRTR